MIVEIKHFKPKVFSSSCVGFTFKEFPMKSGNYCTITGGPYLVNLWAENLTEWSNRNPDVKTIEVTVFSSKGGRSIGLVTDKRLKEWTNLKPCVTGSGWPSEEIKDEISKIMNLDSIPDRIQIINAADKIMLAEKFSWSGSEEENLNHIARAGANLLKRLAKEQNIELGKVEISFFK